MTLILNTSGVLDPFGLPILAAAPTITRAGSLLYVDPTYPDYPWATGFPTSIPNLAALRGTSLATSLGAKDLTLSSTLTAPNLMERTLRGAAHVAWKKGTGASTVNQNVAYEQASIRNYMAATPSHLYYLGLAGRMTQDSATGSPTATTRFLGMIVSSTVDYASIRLATTGIGGQPLTNRTLSTIAPRTADQFFSDAAFSILSGTPGASNAMLMWHNGGSGSPGASWMLQAAVIEDLFVSGITAQQAHDSFIASTTAMTAGRYANDTWTPPTAL
jgi:hypothetical protein